MDKKDVLQIYDENYAQEYNHRFLLDPEFEFRKNSDFEQETIGKLLDEIGAGAKWLDVACGTGYFLSLLPHIERTGLDISPAMLNVAKQANPNAVFVQGDYRDQRLHWEGKWDLVSCMWWAYCYVDSLSELEIVIENFANWTSTRGICFLPLCDPLMIYEGEVKFPYTTKYIDGYSGFLQLEGIIWSWKDEKSGKQHLNLLGPQVEYMVNLFKKHFEQVEILEYPSLNQGGKRKAIVARSKKQKHPLETKTIDEVKSVGLFSSFFQLVRGANWWLYKIPPLLAIAYATILLQATPPQTAIVTLLALLISMFFVAAYGHVTNDIFDIEIDKRASKPNQMASLSVLERILVCTSLAFAGLVPWLFIDFSIRCALLLAGIYTLLTVYSAPPIRLKERGLWGVIADAAAVHAVPTLFVATVFSQLGNFSQSESVSLAIVATLWAFLVGIRGIVLHQIWDWENDLVAGVNTLVTKIGVESARSWLSFVIFPGEIVMLSLLVFVISQFAPLLNGFFIIYVVLRGVNINLTSSPSFDPAPAVQKYIPAHDFYEAWLPLALLVLLSVREALFIPLLVFHIVVFFPNIRNRLLEFNPLLLAGWNGITKLISSRQNQSAKKTTKISIKSNSDDIQIDDQALEFKPDDAQIHWQLGKALVQQNRYGEAIAAYQTALQFHPDNFEIYLELGKALEQEQKWDEAIAAYRLAIELNPDYSWSHKHLGDLLAEQGQIEEASLYYRRALQLQPRIF